MGLILSLWMNSLCFQVIQFVSEFINRYVQPPRLNMKHLRSIYPKQVKNKMRWHFLLVLFLVQVMSQPKQDMRHSAQETRSDSSGDGRSFIPFQTERSFCCHWDFGEKGDGRDCLFFTLIYRLVIKTRGAQRGGIGERSVMPGTRTRPGRGI